MKLIDVGYRLLRPLFFSQDPEKAHKLTLRLMDLAYRFGLLRNKPGLGLPVDVMGIQFPNPVGLAAGMDKNGDYIDALATLGFGFIEVGTVTPRAQPGNPLPRMFRLVDKGGIINRMGFNNAGVDVLVRNIQRSSYRGVLGVNIGKNADTPIENAVEDYLICLRKVYAYASFVVINISSPNTRNLRSLQNAEEFDRLLAALKAEQKLLSTQYEKYVPLAVKIAPDLDTENIQKLAQLIIAHNMDGVISSNTTVSRPGVEQCRYADEAGGLSGAPLKDLANTVQTVLAQALNGKVPIIGCGGIMRGQDAVAKIELGASLVQIYSGMVYHGPNLVRECIDSLRKHHFAQSTPVVDAPLQ